MPLGEYLLLKLRYKCATSSYRFCLFPRECGDVAMSGDQLKDQLSISSRPNTWTIYAWFLVHSLDTGQQGQSVYPTK
jgi:hypothetical protein